MCALTSLELFAGAGGLAKGVELNGVEHCAFVEWNAPACETLKLNFSPKLVQHVDVKEYDFGGLGQVDIIAGGPPCQPFSQGGKHKGETDDRDMFPYACDAITKCRPKAFIFENVKGLLRKSFASYFNYIILQLSYPDVVIRAKETWTDHLSRLERLHTSGECAGTKYNVVYRLVNAADYGVPQKRERVVIVGIRADLGVEWAFPAKTHSLESLLHQQFGSGDYWERHGIIEPDVSIYDPQMSKRISKLKAQGSMFDLPLRPWPTVRDQLVDVPEPDYAGDFHREHIRRDGAKIYPGHTGSFIDLPAKTLKAGGHGVPGGENMIRYHNGDVRYFTTYEAKLMQTFPKDYAIHGCWTESMRQIGNAVPVELARVISGSIVTAGA